MKKVRVLYSGDTSALNGASLYVARLIKHTQLFEGKGYTLMLSEDDVIKRSCKECISDYTKSTKYKLKRRIKDLLSKSKIGSVIYIYFAWLRHAKKVSHYNIEHEDDIILANDIFCAYYIIKRNLKIPVVLVMHNSGNPFTMLLRTLPKANNDFVRKRLKKISSTVYENVVSIVFVSDTSRKLFLEENPYFRGQAIHITEGLEDIDCNYKHDFSELSFITIGSVCQRKNQFSIIKVFCEEMVKDANLTVIGVGDDYERCCRYVIENNLSNIKMIGAIDNRQIVEWLNCSNIFIMNSLDEGLPAVGIEALRNGLPIIISDVGGCRELIDGNGILIPPNNDESLKKAIKCFTLREVNLDELSRKSRKLFEKDYSVERMVNQYCDLFNQIIWRKAE